MRKVQAFVMIVIGGMFTTATGLLVRHALTLQSPAAILGIAVAACVMAALAFVFLVGSFAVGRMAPAPSKPRPTPGSKTPTPGATSMPVPPGFVPPVVTPERKVYEWQVDWAKHADLKMCLTNLTLHGWDVYQIFLEGTEHTGNGYPFTVVARKDVTQAQWGVK